MIKIALLVVIVGLIAMLSFHHSPSWVAWIFGVVAALDGFLISLAAPPINQQLWAKIMLAINLLLALIGAAIIYFGV